MYAEIIASGTELLMGEIQDTNSSFLAKHLPSLGLELRRITLVGDDLAQYSEILERSLRQNDFTFTTGGLGPTVDDLTREAIAKVFKEETFVDDQLLEDMKALFRTRGVDMPPRNIKQAWLIPSAKGIRNRIGTAPGWWAEKDGHSVIALPGPPNELYQMWDLEVVPKLRESIKGSVVLSRAIKTIGLSEALVDEMASDYLHSENPYVGIYARPDGIYLRIIAKGASQDEAQRLLQPVDEKLRGIFKDAVWGIDDETAESSVGSFLKEHDLTLATMESCTGGMLADSITNVPGSSTYYKGGVVSYTNELKIASGVPAGLIEEHGAVSSQVAEAMANAVRLRLGADFGIGITGAAGPDPLEGKPPGTVFIGVAHAGGCESSYYRFPSNNRGLVKRRAVTMALLDLRRILGKAQGERR